MFWATIAWLRECILSNSLVSQWQWGSHVNPICAKASTRLPAADLGMSSVFGRTEAPQKGAPSPHKRWSNFGRLKMRDINQWQCMAQSKIQGIAKDGNCKTWISGTKMQGWKLRYKLLCTAQTTVTATGGIFMLSCAKLKRTGLLFNFFLFLAVSSYTALIHSQHISCNKRN